MEEKKLLKEISQGNKKAFDVLFLSYYPKMERFLSHLLGDQMAAEDIAQDLFLKIWDDRLRLVEIKNLNAYLFSASKNRALNYLNSKYNTIFSSDEIEDYQVPTAEDLENELFSKELSEQIDAVVDKMPARRKEIYQLSRKVHLSNDKIAFNLKISKHTVERQISYALADIRKMITIMLFIFNTSACITSCYSHIVNGYL